MRWRLANCVLVLSLESLPLPPALQSSRRVYVGGLPLDVRSSEVKDIFSKFGPIKDVDIKVPRGGPGTHM